MKKRILWLIEGLVILILGGCNQTTPSGSARSEGGGGRQLRIGVIPKNTQDDFWKTVHLGATQAAGEEGVEMIWAGPATQNDPTRQIRILRGMSDNAVDGVVVAPLDDKSLAPAVRDVLQADVPVVVFESNLQYKGYSSFVATDNFEAGRLGARSLVRMMGGEGKVLLLRYVRGTSSTAERTRGFLAGIEEYSPQISLVSTNQFGGSTAQEAFRVSRKLLARYGGDLDGIYCVNESTSTGMLQALKASGKAGKVKFLGFDTNHTLLTALRAGEISGLIVQDAFNIGYMALKTMVAVIRGKQFVRRIDTGVMLVTRENIDYPQVQELLRPLTPHYD